MELGRDLCDAWIKQGVQAQCSSVAGPQFLETLGALWTQQSNSLQGWMLYPASKWKGFLEGTASSNCTGSKSSFPVRSKSIEILTSAESLLSFLVMAE